MGICGKVQESVESAAHLDALRLGGCWRRAVVSDSEGTFPYKDELDVIRNLMKFGESQSRLLKKFQTAVTDIESTISNLERQILYLFVCSWEMESSHDAFQQIKTTKETLDKDAASMSRVSKLRELISAESKQLRFFYGKTRDAASATKRKECAAAGKLSKHERVLSHCGEWGARQVEKTRCRREATIHEFQNLHIGTALSSQLSSLAVTLGDAVSEISNMLQRFAQRMSSFRPALKSLAVDVQKRGFPSTTVDVRGFPSEITPSAGSPSPVEVRIAGPPKQFSVKTPESIDESSKESETGRAQSGQREVWSKTGRAQSGQRQSQQLHCEVPSQYSVEGPSKRQTETQDHNVGYPRFPSSCSLRMCGEFPEQ